jgi:tRNA(Ile2) C34 agmatinyltransferase TiaS
MSDYCHCGERVFAEGEFRCTECEASYQRDLAHYAPLYRAGALPPGPWRSREDLIRDADD